ncbi:DUF4190 domain-containing protein [Blastococcus sp. SYSU D00820]
MTSPYPTWDSPATTVAPPAPPPPAGLAAAAVAGPGGQPRTRSFAPALWVFVGGSLAVAVWGMVLVATFESPADLVPLLHAGPQAVVVLGAGLLLPRRVPGPVPLLLWAAGTGFLVAAAFVADAGVLWLLTLPLAFTAYSAAALLRLGGTGPQWRWLLVPLVGSAAYTLFLGVLGTEVLAYLARSFAYEPDEGLVHSTEGMLVGALLLLATTLMATRADRARARAARTRPVPAIAGFPPAGSPPAGFPPAGSPADRTCGLAVAALVLGLTGIGIGAVVCGHLALAQIRRTGERGHGMAVAAVVLGYVALVVGIALVVWYVVLLAGLGVF